MALPRLTGALRSFSNVTKQDNYNEEVADLKVNFLNGKHNKCRMWADIWHSFSQFGVLKMVSFILFGVIPRRGMGMLLFPIRILKHLWLLSERIIRTMILSSYVNFCC